MSAVGDHRVLAPGDPAQKRKADVENRQAEDQERHGKRNDGVKLEQARHGKRGEDIAEEGRAGVPHEDLGRVHVVGNEAEACAEQRDEDNGDVDLLHEQRDDDERRRGNGGNADGETVQTVDEVDSVRDGDDPDDRDRNGEPAEADIGRVAEHVRVGEKLDHAAVVDGHGRRRDLHKKLGERLERQNIVQHAEHHDHDGAEQNAADGPVNVGEDQNGQQERDENGKSSETWNGRLVHPAVILRYVDRADLIGKALDHRRRQKGYDGRDSQRGQHFKRKLRCHIDLLRSAGDKAHLFIDLAQGLVRKVGGALRAGLVDAFEISLVAQQVLRFLTDRAHQLHDSLADGGLEHAVALIGKFGLRLGQRFAGRGAVDGQQVRDAGLVLAVVTDGGLAVGHGALEFAHDILGLIHEEDAAVGIGL